MASYYYPVQTFLSLYGGLGVVNVTPNDSGPPTLEFVEGTSSGNQTFLNNAAASFDWVAVSTIPSNIPEPPSSNPAAFMAAVWADETLSAAAKVEIANIYPLLVTNIANGGVITQYWTYLVASVPSWLDSGTQTIILGYATTYGIPLT